MNTAEHIAVAAPAYAFPSYISKVSKVVDINMFDPFTLR